MGILPSMMITEYFCDTVVKNWTLGCKINRNV